MEQGNAELVRDFTQQSKNIKIPNSPVPMNLDRTHFLAKMIGSETVEFLMSHYKTHAEALHVLIQLLQEDYAEKNKNSRECSRKWPLDPKEQTDEQMDALVDVMYYAYDSACQHGQNLDAMFRVVHTANMNKRNPETGKFERRPEDGKIIKPQGWTPPDTLAEVSRQIKEGSFSD